uniref:Inactive serine protease PAMR1 isoform X2 n=1 Tax=Danio rerio TaxID=7955 RepID=A0A1L1QZP6_DANRE|nr:inactive serine protease PAMR1-like [Danio rerio]|eukprot:XP_017212577.1 inactive serine protease PAMR1-like [Danio rerio]
MLSPAGQLAVSAGIWMAPESGYHSASLLVLLYLLQLLSTGASWPNVFRSQEDKCPGPQWNAMCRTCCEYEQIACKCPSQGVKVGYAVPCCRNVLDECDPCILHQGCSIFDNCKTCSNGTWQAKDDFYIRGRYCTSCRQGWSGGDCLTCGEVIQRPHGHVTLESYPINAKCEWTLKVGRGTTMELRFSMISLESDHSCQYDYVEVRDGDSLKSPVIGRYCGDESPGPIKSSGNSLHIRFVSDGYNNYDGFFATFQEVSGQAPALCATPKKPANGDLFLRYNEGGLLHSAQYLCYKPYQLKGASQRACLPNGTWSGTAPVCIKEVAIKDCPAPPQLHNGYSTEISASNGRLKYVEYSCNNTYILSGDWRRVCQKNGSWSGSQPMCVRACREPKVSKLVRQKLLKYQPPSRKSPVHKLYSASSQGATEGDSRERAFPAFGDLPPTFHHVYTSIEYECVSALYKPSGSGRRTCLKTGKWSGRHFSCSPACGKLPPASPLNLTEIYWPWHAAIYTRLYNASPLVARTKRRGDTFAVDEEAEEKEEEDGHKKAQKWQLVCSGALVTQHWVVVAAHCVAKTGQTEALGADHLNIVMGKHHLSDPKDNKRLQHIQIAQILIHPNYDPHVLDSDVALLKLADKARISEYISPVCLPRLQGGEVTATQAFLSGWPIADQHGLMTDSEAARTGQIELADVVKCESQFGKHGLAVSMTDNMLCGRQHPLSSSMICPSETGGIVLSPSDESKITSNSQVIDSSKADDADSHHSWELLGLVSFGYDLQGCNPDLYTVYTRVGNFKNWIERNIT